MSEINKMYVGLPDGKTAEVPLGGVGEEVEAIKSSVNSLSGTVNSLSGTVNSLSGTVNSLSSKFGTAVYSKGLYASGTTYTVADELLVVYCSLGGDCISYVNGIESMADNERGGACMVIPKGNTFNIRGNSVSSVAIN